MPGYFYRSLDGLSNFEPGPILFDESMRHTAVLCQDDRLFVFYSNAGDEPEHILCSAIGLEGDWQEWSPSPPSSILYPERPYEGGDLPLQPSQRGAIHQLARQLRDPAIFVEGESLYLLYSVAGEQGIGIAQIAPAT